MIRVFVLYYLSLKATHGYEIQRCLHESGIDGWLTVNSGSIYYALNRLEKEGLICVLREERTGSRLRKVFAITQSGRNALKSEFAAELEKPIYDAGSPKFLAELMLGALAKDEAAQKLGECVQSLKKQRALWEKWRDIKLCAASPRLQRLTFDMTLENLRGQIAWHEELLENLDEYFERSERKKALIADFSPDNEPEPDGKTTQVEKLKTLRAQIKSDPNGALENLERLIAELEAEE